MTNRQELHATVDHMWDFCGRTGRLVVVRWTGFEKLDDAMAHNCDCETTKIKTFKFVSTEKRSAVQTIRMNEPVRLAYLLILALMPVKIGLSSLFAFMVLDMFLIFLLSEGIYRYFGLESVFCSENAFSLLLGVVTSFPMLYGPYINAGRTFATVERLESRSPCTGNTGVSQVPQTAPSPALQFFETSDNFIGRNIFITNFIG